MEKKRHIQVNLTETVDVKLRPYAVKPKDPVVEPKDKKPEEKPNAES